MFDINNLSVAWDFFKLIFVVLILLFIIISFIVALLQRYISKETIKNVLTKPHRGLQNVFGAGLGALTPFCSCSTIPILVGLFKSGAPFGAIISFLLASPLLNPMIIILLIRFFGLKATAIYFVFTFLFSILIGVVVEKMGMETQIKNVTIQGSGHDEITYDKIVGSRRKRHAQVARYAAKDTLRLFVKVIPYLILGASIGAFIYGFVPREFIVKYAGSDNLLAVPTAALIGVPMYVRTETMIPIAKALNASGMSIGAIMALVIGGAGASIPEVTLLSTIFKKKMVLVFVVSIFFVASVTGLIFNLVIG
jgi:hypothetical protein